MIDQRLREIWKAHPKNQLEILTKLDDLHVPLPDLPLFKRAGTYLKALETDPRGARAWLSKRTGELGFGFRRK